MFGSYTKKIISFVLALAFISQYVLSDAAAMVSPVRPEYDVGMLSHIEELDIPSSLGRVEYSMIPEDARRVVIHVQDAHCNYNAQKAISALLSFIFERCGVGVVNLEGGAGPYDLSPFTRIKDPASRLAIAGHFMREGTLSAGEYFGITNPDELELWGVEDAELYYRNLGVYRSFLDDKEKALRITRTLERALNVHKVSIYSEEMLKLDRNYAGYKSGNKPLRDYLTYIEKVSKEAGMTLEGYPNLSGLFDTVRREGDIDFKMADIERDELFDLIRKDISSNGLEMLIVLMTGYKRGEISSDEFYERVFDIARFLRIDMTKFPNLTGYVSYRDVFAAVDKIAIFDELKGLEKELRDQLARTELERELAAISRAVTLAGSLFEVKLTPGDHRELRYEKELLSARSIAEFLTRAGSSNENVSRLDEELELFEACLGEMSRFYEYAFKRDSVFLDNLKFSKCASGVESAILVTGGFHTTNLARIARDRGMAFISVMPSFGHDETMHNPYHDLLAGRPVGLQGILDAAMSTIQIANILNPVLSPDRERFALSMEIIEAAMEAKDKDCLVMLEDGQMVLGIRWRNDMFEVDRDPPYEQLSGAKVFHIAREGEGRVLREGEPEVSRPGAEDIVPGGTWFNNQFYASWIAPWLETIVSLGLGFGMVQVLTFLSVYAPIGTPVLFAGTLATAVASSAFFYFMHNPWLYGEGYEIRRRGWHVRVISTLTFFAIFLSGVSTLFPVFGFGIEAWPALASLVTVVHFWVNNTFLVEEDLDVLVSEAIESVLEGYDGPYRVMNAGSSGRGTALESSDIDLNLLFHEPDFDPYSTYRGKIIEKVKITLERSGYQITEIMDGRSINVGQLITFFIEDNVGSAQEVQIGIGEDKEIYADLVINQFEQIEEIGGEGASDSVKQDIKMMKKLFKFLSCYDKHRGGFNGPAVEQLVIQSGETSDYGREIHSMGSFHEAMNRIYEYGFDDNGNLIHFDVVKENFTLYDPEYKEGEGESFIYKLNPMSWARLANAAKKYRELRQTHDSFGEEDIGALDYTIEDAKAYREDRVHAYHVTSELKYNKFQYKIKDHCQDFEIVKIETDPETGRRTYHYYLFFSEDSSEEELERIQELDFISDFSPDGPEGRLKAKDFIEFLGLGLRGLFELTEIYKIYHAIRVAFDFGIIFSHLSSGRKRSGFLKNIYFLYKLSSLSLDIFSDGILGIMSDRDNMKTLARKCDDKKAMTSFLLSLIRELEERGEQKENKDEKYAQIHMFIFLIALARSFDPDSAIRQLSEEDLLIRTLDFLDGFDDPLSFLKASALSALMEKSDIKGALNSLNEMLDALQGFDFAKPEEPELLSKDNKDKAILKITDLKLYEASFFLSLTKRDDTEKVIGKLIGLWKDFQSREEERTSSEYENENFRKLIEPLRQIITSYSTENKEYRMGVILRALAECPLEAIDEFSTQLTEDDHTYLLNVFPDSSDVELVDFFIHLFSVSSPEMSLHENIQYIRENEDYFKKFSKQFLDRNVGFGMALYLFFHFEKFESAGLQIDDLAIVLGIDEYIIDSHRRPRSALSMDMFKDYINAPEFVRLRAEIERNRNDIGSLLEDLPNKHERSVVLRAILSNAQNAIVTQSLDSVLEYSGSRGVLRGMTPLKEKVNIEEFTLGNITEMLNALGYDIQGVEDDCRRLGISFLEKDGKKLVVFDGLNVFLSAYRGSAEFDHAEANYLTHAVTTAICHYANKGGEAHGDHDTLPYGANAFHEFDLGFLMLEGRNNREIDANVSLAFHYEGVPLPEYARKRTVILKGDTVAGHIRQLLEWQIKERKAKQNINQEFGRLLDGELQDPYDLEQTVDLIKHNLGILQNECGLKDEYYHAVFGFLDDRFFDELLANAPSHWEDRDRLTGLFTKAMERGQVVISAARSGKDVVVGAHPWISEQKTLLDYLANEEKIRENTFEDGDLGKISSNELVTPEPSPAQIGKRVNVQEAHIDEDHLKIRIEGKEGEEKLSLTSKEKFGEDQKEAIARAAQDRYKGMIKDLLRLAEDLDIHVYSDLIEDLFGLSDSRQRFVALHSSIADDPVALFHEIGHFLIDKKILSFTLDGKTLIAKVNGKEVFSEELERIALLIAQKNVNDPHYLLRAFQRQVFGGKDKRLTETIEIEQKGDEDNIVNFVEVNSGFMENLEAQTIESLYLRDGTEQLLSVDKITHRADIISDVFRMFTGLENKPELGTFSRTISEVKEPFMISDEQVALYFGLSDNTKISQVAWFHGIFLYLMRGDGKNYPYIVIKVDKEQESLIIFDNINNNEIGRINIASKDWRHRALSGNLSSHELLEKLEVVLFGEQARLFFSKLNRFLENDVFSGEFDFPQTMLTSQYFEKLISQINSYKADNKNYGLSDLFRTHEDPGGEIMIEALRRFRLNPSSLSPLANRYISDYIMENENAREMIVDSIVYDEVDQLVKDSDFEFGLWKLEEAKWWAGILSEEIQEYIGREIVLVKVKSMIFEAEKLMHQGKIEESFEIYEDTLRYLRRQKKNIGGLQDEISSLEGRIDSVRKKCRPLSLDGSRESSDNLNELLMSIYSYDYYWSEDEKGSQCEILADIYDEERSDIRVLVLKKEEESADKQFIVVFEKRQDGFYYVADVEVDVDVKRKIMWNPEENKFQSDNDYLGLAIRMLLEKGIINEWVSGWRPHMDMSKFVRMAVDSFGREEGDMQLDIRSDNFGQYRISLASVKSARKEIVNNRDKGLQVRDYFDENKAEEVEGVLQFEAQISDYEKVYSYRNRAYVIWTEGINRGQIYRIIDRPSEERILSLPTMEEIEAEIDDRLEEIDRLLVSSSSESVREAELDLLIFLHKLYNGENNTVGLKQAQLFSLDDQEDAKYRNFLKNIRSVGLKGWIIKRAEGQGLSLLMNEAISYLNEKKFSLYYYGNEKGPRIFSDPDNPVYLYHGTYDNLLTNIIALGALAAPGYFEKVAEIPKRCGGEGGGKKSYTPKSVSFWDVLNKDAFITGGYGSQRGFEIPMAFCIGEQSLSISGNDWKLIDGSKDIENGTLSEEKTIPYFVDLKFITHVFVPRFAIEEVKSILAQHGFGHIKVVALGAVSLADQGGTHKVHSRVSSESPVQIGKRAKVQSVSKDEKKIVVKDSNGEEHNIDYIESTFGDVTSDITGAVEDENKTHKQAVNAILKLLEHSPPREKPDFAVFDTLIEDLFGLASPEQNLIALHQSVANNPVAVFHEIGEYLLQSEEHDFEMSIDDDYSLLTLSIGGEDPFTIELTGEAKYIAEKVAENPEDKENHYLLRAFQRQVFGEADKQLSQKIIKEQERAKSFYGGQPEAGQIGNSPQISNVSIRPKYEDGIEVGQVLGHLEIILRTWDKTSGEKVHILPLAEERSIPDNFGNMESIFKEKDKIHVPAHPHTSVYQNVLNHEKTKEIHLFNFDELVGNNFGFSLPEQKSIAIYQWLAEDDETLPISLFHEIGEYLIAEGDLSITYKKPQYSSNNPSLFISLSGDLKEIELSDETIAFIDSQAWDYRWERKPHYLLRVLQREMFGENDAKLSTRIKVISLVEEYFKEEYFTEDYTKESMIEGLCSVADSLIEEEELLEEKTHLSEIQGFIEGLIIGEIRSIQNGRSPGEHISKVDQETILLVKKIAASMISATDENVRRTAPREGTKAHILEAVGYVLTKLGAFENVTNAVQVFSEEEEKGGVEVFSEFISRSIEYGRQGYYINSFLGGMDKQNIQDLIRNFKACNKLTDTILRRLKERVQHEDDDFPDALKGKYIFGKYTFLILESLVLGSISSGRDIERSIELFLSEDAEEELQKPYKALIELMERLSGKEKGISEDIRITRIREENLEEIIKEVIKDLQNIDSSEEAANISKKIIGEPFLKFIKGMRRAEGVKELRGSLLSLGDFESDSGHVIKTFLENISLDEILTIPESLEDTGITGDEEWAMKIYPIFLDLSESFNYMEDGSRYDPGEAVMILLAFMDKLKEEGVSPVYIAQSLSKLVFNLNTLGNDHIFDFLQLETHSDTRSKDLSQKVLGQRQEIEDFIEIIYQFSYQEIDLHYLEWMTREFIINFTSRSDQATSEESNYSKIMNLIKEDILGNAQIDKRQKGILIDIIMTKYWRISEKNEQQDFLNRVGKVIHNRDNLENILEIDDFFQKLDGYDNAMEVILETLLFDPYEQSTDDILGVIRVVRAWREEKTIENRDNLLKCFKRVSFDASIIQFFDGGNNPTVLRSLLLNILLDAISEGKENHAARSYDSLEKKAFPLPPEDDGPSGEDAREEMVEIDGIDVREGERLPLSSLSKTNYGIKWWVLGRTLIVEQNGEYYAVKLLKKGENVEEFKREHQVIDWVHQNKERLGLRSDYPEPVFLNGDEHIATMSWNHLPDDVWKKLSETAGADGKYSIDIESSGEEREVTLICYKTTDKGYFEYLNDADAIEENDDFKEATLRSMHDLAIFAREGIVNVALIDLFHNLEHGRRYLWMVDIISPMSRRNYSTTGAGRLHSWLLSVMYPNFRKTGLADMGELTPLKTVLEEGMLGDRSSAAEDEAVALASYLGDYLLSWALVYAGWLKRKDRLDEGTWKDESEISDMAETIEEVFTETFSVFLTGDASFVDAQAERLLEDVSGLVDWKRMARQIAFFMGGAYRQHVVNKDIPLGERGVYPEGSEIEYPEQLSSSRGWGGIHENVIREFWSERGLSEDEIEKIIKFMIENVKISDDEGIFNLAAFDDPGHGIIAGDRHVKNFNDLKWQLGREILDELNVSKEYKNEFDNLLDLYRYGWRHDGQYEDLGPVNGPNPLTELVKALYMFGFFGVNEFHERIDAQERAKDTTGEEAEDRELTDRTYMTQAHASSTDLIADTNFVTNPSYIYIPVEGYKDSTKTQLARLRREIRGNLRDNRFTQANVLFYDPETLDGLDKRVFSEEKGEMALVFVPEEGFGEKRGDIFKEISGTKDAEYDIESSRIRFVKSNAISERNYISPMYYVAFALKILELERSNLEYGEFAESAVGSLSRFMRSAIEGDLDVIEKELIKELESTPGVFLTNLFSGNKSVRFKILPIDLQDLVTRIEAERNVLISL